MVSGLVYGATGTYRPAFFIFSIGVALVAMLVLAAVPPRKSSDDNQEF
jgi:hypothetical protein